MEVTEHASAFLKSQVTFAVVQLGVPDKLLQDGPMTAAQLAAACGAADAEWLERVLRAAASIGLLGVRRVPRRNRDAASPDTDAIGKVTPAAAPEPLGGHEYVFSANAATAVLSTSHPSSMAPLVRLYQYNYLSSGALGKVCVHLCQLQQQQHDIKTAGECTTCCVIDVITHHIFAIDDIAHHNCVFAHAVLQSLQRGMTSHELQTGTSFWAHLAADGDKGAVFDAAMHTFKDLGGASVVSGYKWCAAADLPACLPACHGMSCASESKNTSIPMSERKLGAAPPRARPHVCLCRRCPFSCAGVSTATSWMLQVETAASCACCWVHTPASRRAVSLTRQSKWRAVVAGQRARTPPWPLV
jgi:Dimerisation domain